MSRFRKLESFFEKHREWEFQEKFDILISSGMSYKDQKLLLHVWFQFNISTFALVSYAKKRGLWEQRQIALSQKLRRKFTRKWDIGSYVRKK